MKKVLIICMAVAMATASFAQKGLQVGVIGGPQSTWLLNKNDSDDPNVKFKSGFRGFVGATVDYHFTDQVGVGIEILYSMQGQSYSDLAGLDYKINVNYVKIPVLLNFNSNPEHVAMFVGKFGPTFGFNTAAKGKVDGFPDTDLKSNYSSTNIGMVLGLGLGINATKHLAITLGLRLDGGLTDAMKSNPDPTYFSYYNGDTHTADLTRKKTWSEAGGIEIGIKYTIPVGK
jgi:hypothetical protein